MDVFPLPSPRRQGHFELRRRKNRLPIALPDVQSVQPVPSRLRESRTARAINHPPTAASFPLRRPACAQTTRSSGVAHSAVAPQHAAGRDAPVAAAPRGLLQLSPLPPFLVVVPRLVLPWVVLSQKPSSRFALRLG
jgi:hypothetical protein